MGLRGRRVGQVFCQYRDAVTVPAGNLYVGGRCSAELLQLVPLLRGFDGLDVGLQGGQLLGRNENLDAAWYAGLAANEAGAFEIEDHLVY
jgi:hypothetical protein